MAPRPLETKARKGVAEAEIVPVARPVPSRSEHHNAQRQVVEYHQDDAKRAQKIELPNAFFWERKIVQLRFERY